MYSQYRGWESKLRFGDAAVVAHESHVYVLLSMKVLYARSGGMIVGLTVLSPEWVATDADDHTDHDAAEGEPVCH